MSVVQELRSMLKDAHPRAVREQIRKGAWTESTTGLAGGYAQANLAILPKDLALDFLVFCLRNPKPCPVLDVTEAGNPEPRIAPGADLRTDVGRYRIYRKGQMEAEVTDITPYWRDDLVAFVIGCSFSFEHALVNSGIPVRSLELGQTPPVYITGVECVPAGPFHGPMAVSMRPLTHQQAIRAVQITSRMPGVHGAPVHIGDPAAIGIKDVGSPNWGLPLPIAPGETPVFWACGVTPQAVAMATKPEFMITHSPGHMFVTDLRNDDLAIL